MWGHHHIVEVDDIGEKIELIRKARSIADFDFTALARSMGIRSDHLARMLTQTKFRYKTILKMSDALGVPPGAFFWEWSELKNYLEKVKQ